MPKDIPGVMREYKEGALHSGSKKGPVVKNPKQAIAIALSEQRQMGKDVPPPKKRGKGKLSAAIGVAMKGE